ncbi:unnamed protein product [Triticum turgidum subsp. durum]|uniref:ATP synthase subunit n=1 Tax=Triticum turgidum subsp. durum TaxID=4567 RepID=A0A9R0VJN8_TRITD|nr:unnamed protein product [Triticum turgidum subsp. durum]
MFSIVLKPFLCSLESDQWLVYIFAVFFSLPGRYEALWKEVDGVKQLWKNRKELKVEDLGIATLFGVELYAWFCVGEIAGRGFTLTGYKV